MQETGKLRQNIANFVAKDFSAWTNITQSQSNLDKKRNGKSCHEGKISLSLLSQPVVLIEIVSFSWGFKVTSK